MSEPTSPSFEAAAQDVSVPLFKYGLLAPTNLASFNLASVRLGENHALLRCIADHIHNKEQLSSLCRVSKTFQLAFTPALYREMDIVTSKSEYGRDIFEALPNNPHLRHVRRLQLDLNHRNPRGPVNSIVRSLARRMPMLEEFEWDGGVLLQETQMTIRLSCLRLKSFVMLYEPPWEVPVWDYKYRSSRNRRLRDCDTYREDRSDLCYSSDDKGHIDEVQSALDSADVHHLVPFSGLTKLKIGDMHGHYEDLKDDWKADILRVLLACPDLEELSLGFGDDCVRLLVGGFATLLSPFLRSLCEEYHARGGKPLKLRALGLGLGVLLKSASSLSKLVDLEHLQEVYIDNRGKIDRHQDHCQPDGGWVGNTGIAWRTFSQANTPNLRQVQLASDVVDFEELGEYLTSLIPSPIRTQIQNAAVRKRSGLNQVILKLWDTRMQPVRPVLFIGDAVDGLFQLLDDGVAPQGNALTADGLDTAWQAFFGLAASSSRLVVYTKPDRGLDGIMNVDKLEAGLRTLPHVRDLVVACPLNFGRLDDLHAPKLISLRGEATSDSLLPPSLNSPAWREAVALRLARAGKGLRTVKFGRMAWRVLRGGGDDGSEVTMLLSMDKYEQRRHGCDRGPASAFPEFAIPEVERSREPNFYCDFVVRMW